VQFDNLLEGELNISPLSVGSRVSVRNFLRL